MKPSPLAARHTALLCFSALLLSACGKPAATAVALSPMVIPVCTNDECAVLDQTGKVVVGTDNPYSTVVSTPLDTTFIYARKGLWNLASGDGKQLIKPDFSEELRMLTPGYFGFVRDGRLGIMDQSGHQVQAPAYDSLWVSGENEFISYEIDGKYGLLSPDGQVITAAVFDETSEELNYRKFGGWMMATRDGQHWAVNSQTREHRQVDFDAITEFANGHLVVSRGGLKGLADAKGNLLSEIKYYWMGAPGDGLVAFKSEYGQPCGYLDFQGKVAIAPAFSTCEMFGHKGAMAITPATDGAKGKAGLLGRDGKWLIAPGYDWAGPAGHGVMGNNRDVPGYAQVGRLQNAFVAHWGIFDLNQGVELFKTQYSQIGVLTPELFVFAKPDSPGKEVTLFGQKTTTPSVGVMDAKGKALIEPGQYVSIQLDTNGQYLRALSDTSAQATMALYDLKGKQLVPAQWQELVIDQARGAIFAYQVEGVVGEQSRSLRAMYRLDGTPVFVTRQTACGALQVLDGNDKVLFPADPEQHCPSEDEAA